MSTLEVNSIQPLSSGTTVTLGASGKLVHYCEIDWTVTLDITET